MTGSKVGFELVKVLKIWRFTRSYEAEKCFMRMLI